MFFSFPIAGIFVWTVKYSSVKRSGCDNTFHVFNYVIIKLKLIKYVRNNNNTNTAGTIFKIVYLRFINVRSSFNSIQSFKIAYLVWQR